MTEDKQIDGKWIPKKIGNPWRLPIKIHFTPKKY
jgi:hypothetical protein